MAAEKTELNIRDMLERVWRNRDNIFLFQLLTLVLTLSVVLFWPRTYASEAQLFMQRGRESVGLDPMTATGPSIGIQQSGRDGEIKTAIEVLASRGVIEPVVKRVGADVILGHESLKDTEKRKSNIVAGAIKGTVGWLVTQIRKIDPASDFERAVVNIERNMTVHAERKAEIIRIVYEADSPELAQHVVNNIVAEYTKKHPDLYATKGSTAFFEDQNERLREEFETISNRLSDAKNEMGLISIGEQTTILQEQLGAIRDDMFDTDKRLSTAKATNADLVMQLRSVPKRISMASVSKPNHASDLQSQALFDMQVQLSDAKSRFKSSHPTLRSLQAAYDNASAQHRQQKPVREESTDNVNPVHERLSMDFTQNQAELAGLTAASKKLNSQEQEVLTNIAQMNEESIAIRMLEVEVQTAERKLIAYGASLEDARVDEQRQLASMSSITVSQPATLQEKPVSPSKPVSALVGMMMCLGGSVLIALLSIQSDDTLISPYAVTSNIRDVPVLGSLPRSRSFSKVLA